MDPPFKEYRIKILLQIIKDKKILKRNGIILIHREKKLLEQFPDDLRIIDAKNYGRSKVFFTKFD